MTPSVVRAVHYVSHGTPLRADTTQAYSSECRAAIITAVGEQEQVSLCAINPTGLFFSENVAHDEGKSPGTWHWPERVD